MLALLPVFLHLGWSRGRCRRVTLSLRPGSALRPASDQPRANTDVKQGVRSELSARGTAATSVPRRGIDELPPPPRARGRLPIGPGAHVDDGATPAGAGMAFAGPVTRSWLPRYLYMSHREWLEQTAVQLHRLHAADLVRVEVAERRLRAAELDLAESRGHLQAVLELERDLRGVLAHPSVARGEELGSGDE